MIVLATRIDELDVTRNSEKYFVKEFTPIK